MAPNWITIQEATRRLPYSESWLREMVRTKGFLNGRKEGRRWFVDEAEVERRELGDAGPDDLVDLAISRKFGRVLQGIEGGLRPAGPKVVLANLSQNPVWYGVNRNGSELVEIQLYADLVNAHDASPGVLHLLEIRVETGTGTFVAQAQRPRRGDVLSPGYIFPAKVIAFTGRRTSEAVPDWEPLIRGSRASVVLEVSGQSALEYQVLLTDNPKMYTWP